MSLVYYAAAVESKFDLKKKVLFSSSTVKDWNVNTDYIPGYSGTGGFPGQFVVLGNYTCCFDCCLCYCS